MRLRNVFLLLVALCTTVGCVTFVDSGGKGEADSIRRILNSRIPSYDEVANWSETETIGIKLCRLQKIIEKEISVHGGVPLYVDPQVATMIVQSSDSLRVMVPVVDIDVRTFLTVFCDGMPFEWRVYNNAILVSPQPIQGQPKDREAGQRQEQGE